MPCLLELGTIFGTVLDSQHVYFVFIAVTKLVGQLLPQRASQKMPTQDKWQFLALDKRNFIGVSIPRINSNILLINHIAMHGNAQQIDWEGISWILSTKKRYVSALILVNKK